MIEYGIAPKDDLQSATPIKVGYLRDALNIERSEWVCAPVATRGAFPVGVIRVDNSEWSKVEI